jgi:hypothetical protein
MPTMDAASGDPDAAYGGMDANVSMPPPDAGPGSDLPPTPVDAGMEVVTGMDAGMTPVEPDAGMVQPDAGTVQPDAGVVIADAGTDSGVTSLCVAGRELDGYCWFLGAVGQSCETVCAAHGGFVPSLPYLGTRMQGGALSRCDAVLTLLTQEGDTTAGYREDGRGVGCHFFDNARWWLISPNFNPTASHWRVRQACSCVDK